MWRIADLSNPVFGIEDNSPDSIREYRRGPRCSVFRTETAKETVNMATRQSSQKFIARNRAPRVQIEYDVELYGSEKKVQLPFVVGVMADLAGKSATEQPALADRKMMEIDIDNFDARLKSLQPRVAFRVANTLTEQGELPVDITFESMDDFSPAAVARKVDSLSKLLEARTQLANLLTYMDGKAGAEELVSQLLADPTLLQALGTKPALGDGTPEQSPQSGADSETKED
jgi:type VI secretion system protein ImpB